MVRYKNSVYTFPRISANRFCVISLRLSSPWKYLPLGIVTVRDFIIPL